MLSHKMSNSPEYSAWQSIKARCFNKNYEHYEYYGGKGITVCERWKNSFQAFYQDVGARPSEKHSIDRINNNGHYEPGNVRWALPSTQVINRRTFKKNTSGYTGVIFDINSKKYRSMIQVNKKLIHLGSFKTPEEAAIARDEYILENELAEYPLQILPEP